MALESSYALPIEATSPPPKSSGWNSSKPDRNQMDKDTRDFVFADPLSVVYLNNDPSTKVVERSRKLEGYDIYLVEQWACSRADPTSIIATFTGDPTHSILVDVLRVPVDRSSWSPRLTVYFNAITGYHAKERETPLGTLMVTNLSGFPSSLTVIPVPEGDILSHREDFIVNENLKRLGCSGRAGLALQYPQPSTVAKFHHLYNTSENIPLYESVVELVKLCQVSLLLYGKLAPAYADGLLCDVTESAINEWWPDIGTYIFNVEPNDGILGPSTASGLIGLLMGAHNRLKIVGAPVGKDVFDINTTKHAIGEFQKSQKIERTRRLDRKTLIKLHQSTAKAISGEGWTVPKAVKSTMAELSGKGGEMVKGIVGGREKVGAADIETLDIDRLAELVVGTRSRWLWHGKHSKSTEADPFGPLGASGGDKIFSTDDQGKYMWTTKHRDSVAPGENHWKGERTDDNDSKRPFGRLKDAVGLPSLRTHPARLSKDASSTHLAQDGRMKDAQQGLQQSTRMTTSGPATNEPSMPASETSKGRLLPAVEPLSESTSHVDSADGSRLSREATVDDEWAEYKATIHSDLEKQTTSELLTRHSMDQLSDKPRHSGPLLSDRSLSAPGFKSSQRRFPIDDFSQENPRINRIPRSLSFSILEAVVLDWNSIDLEMDSELKNDEVWPQRILGEQAYALSVQRKSDQLRYLETVSVPYTKAFVRDIDKLEQLSLTHQKDLKFLYYGHLEEFQIHKATSVDLMHVERHQLGDGLRQIEMMGSKLDYELNALRSRIAEVEDSVSDFERSVVHIEDRVEQLFEEDKPREPWTEAFCRFFGLRESRQMPPTTPTVASADAQ